MPLSWFVSRESPGAKSAFVESFGFIASDEPRELNPNRCPTALRRALVGRQLRALESMYEHIVKDSGDTAGRQRCELGHVFLRKTCRTGIHSVAELSIS